MSPFSYLPRSFRKYGVLRASRGKAAAKKTSDAPYVTKLMIYKAIAMCQRLGAIHSASRVANREFQIKTYK